MLAQPLPSVYLVHIETNKDQALVSFIVQVLPLILWNPFEVYPEFHQKSASHRLFTARLTRSSYQLRTIGCFQAAYK